MFGLMPRRKERESAATKIMARSEFPLSALRSGLDELLERFLARWPISLDREWMEGSGMEVKETDEAVVVHADAPGFEPGDFDIQVMGNNLKMVAERKVEGKEKAPTIERRLERLFTLPVGVDPEKVEASYHQGVLELRLPKTEKAKGRKIEVKAT